MAKIPGTQYDFSVTTGQTISFEVTTDLQNPPTPVPGSYNILVYENATGHLTRGDQAPPGYDGGVVLSTDDHSLLLWFGDYEVIDGSSGNNQIVAFNATNVTIGGAADDTIAGGSGNTLIWG